MENNRNPYLAFLGPVLGALLLFLTINYAVDYMRTGQQERILAAELDKLESEMSVQAEESVDATESEEMESESVDAATEKEADSEEQATSEIDEAVEEPTVEPTVESNAEPAAAPEEEAPEEIEEPVAESGGNPILDTVKNALPILDSDAASDSAETD